MRLISKVFGKKNYILEVGQVYLLYEWQVEVEVRQHIVVQDPEANDYTGWVEVCGLFPFLFDE